MILRMRVGTVLSIVVAVNVLWAAAFFGYVHRSTTPVIKPVADSPAESLKANQSPRAPVPAVAAHPATNSPVAVSLTNGTPRAPKTIASADKKFGWQDLTNDTYLDYVG